MALGCSDVSLFNKTLACLAAASQASRKGSVNQGFFGIAETSNLHPDQVEGWVFCRRAFMLPKGCPERDLLAKFWPNPDDELEFREVVAALQTLVKPLTRALLSYVGADPHSFDEKLVSSKLVCVYVMSHSTPFPPLACGRLLGRGWHRGQL